MKTATLRRSRLSTPKTSRRLSGPQMQMLALIPLDDYINQEIEAVEREEREMSRFHEPDAFMTYDGDAGHEPMVSVSGRRPYAYA